MSFLALLGPFAYASFMDASDIQMQEILDRKDWLMAMKLHQAKAAALEKAGDEDAAGFLMTHALVYAYLAGDAHAAQELEAKLQNLDRL